MLRSGGVPRGTEEFRILPRGRRCFRRCSAPLGRRPLPVPLWPFGGRFGVAVFFAELTSARECSYGSHPWRGLGHEEDRVKVFRDLSHEHLAEIQAAQRDNENGETRYGL